MSSHSSVDNERSNQGSKNEKMNAVDKLFDIPPSDENNDNQQDNNPRNQNQGQNQGQHQGQHQQQGQHQNPHQGQHQGHQNQGQNQNQNQNQHQNQHQSSGQHVDPLTWIQNLPIFKKVPKLQKAMNALVSNPAYATNNGSGRIALYGVLCGFGLAWGLSMTFIMPRFARFYLWIASLSFFHLAEFACMSFAQPKAVNAHHFLLFPNVGSAIAFGAACTEYWLGSLFMPKIKAVFGVFGLFGLIMVVLGQVLRTTSMITAGSNFNYDLQHERKPELKLVTEGVYKYVRHPSYHGLFWLLVGQQVLLGNPICTAAFAYQLISFLSKRIADEETGLVKMFGNSYVDYRKRVPVGWPFHVAAAQA